MMDRKERRRGLGIFAGLTLCTLGAYALVAAQGQLSPTRAGAEPEPLKFAALLPAPKPAADPVAPSQAETASQGNVHVTTRLDRDAVLQGSDGRLHVELVLSADAAEGQAVVQPTDVFVVLDTSGSMMGEKIAAAKAALHRLIDRLQPEDRLGVVSFDSDARVRFPLARAEGAAKQHWHAIVNELEAGGGTDMTAGLELAFAQLPAELGNRSSRVLVLSDGHVNGGEASVPGLRERVRSMVRREHVVSTLGIGDEFNENLMTLLADTGAGNFFYLARIDMIGHFLDAEFQAAAETVASSLEVSFEPAPSVSVEDISGYPLENDGKTVRVRPGNLHAGQTRTLWVTLAAPTGKVSMHDLGRFSLAYKQSGKSQKLLAEPLPKIACVAEPKAFEASIHRDVWEKVITSEYYNRAQLALAKAIESGSEQEVDVELHRYEQNRALAEQLGAQEVLSSLARMKQEADTAKVEQKASLGERQLNAKHKKARSYFGRRADNYNSDPLLGL